jgi:hypothetical protein
MNLAIRWPFYNDLGLLRPANLLNLLALLEVFSWIFMPPALLFATRVLAPLLSLCYLVAMLLVPCMPLADVSEQPIAVPRWEYWMIHAAVPSTLWWRWTGGLQDVWISDRIPVFSAASVWLVSAWGLGRLLLLCDPVDSKLTHGKRIVIAVLVGHSALSSIAFVHFSWLGCRSTLVMLGVVGLVAGTLGWIGYRMPAVSRFQDDPPRRDGYPAAEIDASFESSIHRRLVGLLWVACIWLASVQVYGASMPTVDHEVRTTEWWQVKHAIEQGYLEYRRDNLPANGPAAGTMISLTCASILTSEWDDKNASSSDWIASREAHLDRLYVGTVSSKIVHAVLGVAIVFLVGLQLRERWGLLPSLAAAFALLATPGLAELVRLGRTEGMMGVWGAAILCVWQSSTSNARSNLPLGVCWWLLVAGACNYGYGTAVVVGIPAICLAIHQGWVRRYLETKLESHETKASDAWRSVRIALVVLTILSSGLYYFRNAWSTGDPIVPWTQVWAERIGLKPITELGASWSFANRVQPRTISESVLLASDSQVLDDSVSAYRVVNWIDGVSRLMWDSSAHGLLMIPLAAIGLWVSLFFRRDRVAWPATGWFAIWIVCWWLSSPRMDRDWIGAMVFLTWPAAAGVHWMMTRSSSYSLASLLTLGILWSVVVIPVWPTCDHRILVSMRELRPTSAASNSNSRLQTSQKRSSKIDHFGRIHSLLLKEKGLGPDSKILLIGDNDDFDSLLACASNSAFDMGLWQDCVESAISDRLGRLRFAGIDYVLVVWPGVRNRDVLTGNANEFEIRRVLDEMLAVSQLQPIPWGVDAAHAELFQVNANGLNATMPE